MRVIVGVGGEAASFHELSPMHQILHTCPSKIIVDHNRKYFEIDAILVVVAYKCLDKSVKETRHVVTESVAEPEDNITLQIPILTEVQVLMLNRLEVVEEASVVLDLHE